MVTLNVLMCKLSQHDSLKRVKDNTSNLTVNTRQENNGMWIVKDWSRAVAEHFLKKFNTPYGDITAPIKDTSW